MHIPTILSFSYHTLITVKKQLYFIFLLTTFFVNAIIFLTIKVVILQFFYVKPNIGDGSMPLYNRLKEYRARISVNQQEMGTLVGTSRQTISLIERGDYPLPSPLL